MANTGWIREEEDLDYLHNGGLDFQPQQLFGVADEFDTRPIINVEDQGQTSSCEGHALSSLFEACAWIASMSDPDVVPDQFSRWFAYLQAQKQGGHFGSDQGASISGGLKAGHLVGCCKELTLPFPGKYVTRIPNGAMEEAAKFKLRSFTSLRTYEKVFGFMAGGFGGVNIGITWTSALANSNGIVQLADVKGRGLGHALFLWGWSKRVDGQGRHYVWMHNSHTKRWGNMGRAEVAPEVIDWWGASRNNELMGGSDLTGFDQPRELVPDVSEGM